MLTPASARTSASQRPRALSTSSMNSRTAPRPPASRLDPVHARRAPRRPRRPARPRGRRARAPAGPAGRRPCRRRLRRRARALSSKSLIRRRSCRRRPGRRSRCPAPPRAASSPPTAGRSASRRQSRRAAPRRSPRRREWKTPSPRRRATRIDTMPVGQHAVDVEQQRAAACGRGRCDLSGEDSAIRSSASARDRAVDDAFDHAMRIDDDEGRDLALFHQPQRLDGQHDAGRSSPDAAS